MGKTACVVELVPDWDVALGGHWENSDKSLLSHVRKLESGSFQIISV